MANISLQGQMTSHSYFSYNIVLYFSPWNGFYLFYILFQKSKLNSFFSYASMLLFHFKPSLFTIVFFLCFVDSVYEMLNAHYFS